MVHFLSGHHFYMSIFLRVSESITLLHKKNDAKRDHEGAVCNSGIGMLFFMYLICLHYFLKCGEGGLKIFLIHDALCIMQDKHFSFLISFSVTSMSM